MRYLKIIFFLSIFLIVGCGKPPLLNKLKQESREITGGLLLTERLSAINRSFDLKWTVQPSLDELSAFEIELDAPLEEGQTLEAYIWMPDMGHGSSPIIINSSTPKKYEFTELAFIMPGLWVLHIEIFKDNKVIDQWQKSITL